MTKHWRTCSGVILCAALFISVAACDRPCPECRECPVCECPEPDQEAELPLPDAAAAPTESASEPTKSAAELQAIPTQTKEARAECPLIPLRSFVSKNREGETQFELEVQNQSRKTVTSFEFRARCFDDAGSRIKNAGEFELATKRGISWDDYILMLYRANAEEINFAGDFRGTSEGSVRVGSSRKVGVWSMPNHEGCAKAITTITAVQFNDGSSWEGMITEEQETDASRE